MQGVQHLFDRNFNIVLVGHFVEKFQGLFLESLILALQTVDNGHLILVQELRVLLVKLGQSLDSHELLIITVTAHELGQSVGRLLSQFLFRVDRGDASNALVSHCKGNIIINILSPFQGLLQNGVAVL